MPAPLVAEARHLHAADDGQARFAADDVEGSRGGGAAALCDLGEDGDARAGGGGAAVVAYGVHGAGLEEV